MIAETLRAVDADILALQEVWDDGTENQARVLADALGYEASVWGPNLTFSDGVRAGNAIVSRWPIARHEIRTLPREGQGARDDEGEERLVVFAEIEGPRGPIQVFCAHLSWRPDHSGVRQEQIRAICEFVRETRPRPFPAVLLGDLNAPSTSDEIRMLTGLRAVPVPGVVFRDAWTTVHGTDPGYTLANANPFCAATLFYDVRIDYVMLGAPKLGGVGQPLTAALLGNLPVDGVCGSDHYGLAVDLRY